MLEAEIRSGEVKSDVELLEEACRQGRAYEFNQTSPVRPGVGSRCLG